MMYYKTWWIRVGHLSWSANSIARQCRSSAYRVCHPSHIFYFLCVPPTIRWLNCVGLYRLISKLRSWECWLQVVADCRNPIWGCTVLCSVAVRKLRYTIVFCECSIGTLIARLYNTSICVCYYRYGQSDLDTRTDKGNAVFNLGWVWWDLIICAETWRMTP